MLLENLTSKITAS